MKTNLATLLVALFCAVSVFVTGCASTSGGGPTSVERATPNLRPITAVIGVGALVSAEDAKTKRQYAQFMLLVSTTVREIAADGVLNVDDFADRLDGLVGTDADSELQSLVASLISVYRSLYPNVKADLGKYKAALDAIADGLEDAAKPYLKRTSVLSMEPDEDEMFFLIYEHEDIRHVRQFWPRYVTSGWGSISVG